MSSFTSPFTRSPVLSRRGFCVGGSLALGASLSACSTGGPLTMDEPRAHPELASRTISKPDYRAVYGEYPGEPFAIKPFDFNQVDPRYLRQSVEWRGPEGPGTIIVDPANIPSVVDTTPENSFLRWNPCNGLEQAKGRDADCSIVLKYGMKRDFNAWLKTLGDKLSGFNNHSQQISDLIPIIHRPGWTTPAEVLLVTGLVESLLQQSQILDATHAALIRGAQAVGKN